MNPAINLEEFYDIAEKKTKVDKNQQAKVLNGILLRMLCKWLMHTRFIGDKPRLLVYDTTGMDYSAAANKYLVQTAEGDSMKSKIPVCTSELREIFRNLGKLDTHMVWMRNGEVTRAPWMQADEKENMRGWAKYAMYLVFKNLAENPRDKLCIQAAVDISNYIREVGGFDSPDINYSRIIECYRSTDPYQLRDNYALHKGLKFAREICDEEDFYASYEKLVDFKEDLINMTSAQKEKNTFERAMNRMHKGMSFRIKDRTKDDKGRTAYYTGPKPTEDGLRYIGPTAAGDKHIGCEPRKKLKDIDRKNS